ncbi:MAG TPA: nitroreductase family protein [Candidatus Paceibacterota bacterium]|nr:nitroreductase family protein [Verrucomicrobiota bacterium]HRY47792.1 nitroreductase family protein [Candidatus Paceibacterota bacterium]HSA00463.1 nitroreductase family protein [Candidatus Paceibacterota bacterium]
MDALQAIEARRAVKHYDPNHRMPEGEIRRLLSLAMLSPTAFNIQHWRFVLARDPELRRQIRAAAWDQAQVTDASILIILCADLKAWERDPARYWQNAPQPVRDYLVPAIGRYYAGNDTIQRDEIMRSCGIAAQTIMLASKAMGYDSCPMDGFDFNAVGQLIQLPPDHKITMMVAVGKGIKEPWPRAGQLSYEDVVITDRFG